MIKSDATGIISYIAKVKIVLLALAFVIVGGTLWFTHNLVQALQQKDRQIADTYVKSLQYLANAAAGVGDFSFIQGEIITIIDFPMIATDVSNEPLRPYRLNTKNIELDTLLPLQEQDAYLKRPPCPDGQDSHSHQGDLSGYDRSQLFALRRIAAHRETSVAAVR